MDDETAAIRHDLARYRNLLAINSDERTRAVLRAMIAELEARLRAHESAELRKRRNGTSLAC